MVRIFRHYVSPVKITLAITDFIAILACTFLAEWARYAWLGLDISTDIQTLLAKILVPVITVPILLGVGGYQSDSIRDFRVFIVRLLVAILASSLALSAFLYLLPMLPLWRSILVLSMVFSSAIVLIIHGFFLLFADTKFLSRRVVILGAGKEAEELKEYAEKATEAGLNIVGVVQIPGQPHRIDDSIVLEDMSMFGSLTNDMEAEMVLIADDGMHNLPIEALIACKLNGTEIKDRLSFYEQVRGYVALDSVKAEWIIFSDGFRGGSGFERFSKRVLDVLISSIMLLLTAPIMVVAGIMVRLTSRGAIFYKQERVGLYGQTFNLLKFRSMKEDAEKAGKPEWAKESDPRVTLIGNFLRRTRIDELPQIVNVLRGDMSFVGPRPERPFFVRQFEKDIPFYQERHYLKPGITGWAQIQYPYGASFEDSKRKLEYDLYYIKNYSIFLDILIILQTVRVVLFPIGVR